MAGTTDKTTADYYADSYAHFGIHEEMLKDEVRTNAYMNAIERNGYLFKDKVILDVGCGTGILSMFAARAGAKKVYAIDMSTIAVQAREIVNANGFSDVIEVIQGKIEEIELPVDTVDIIISEWMGYFLLYESMLDSVLFARDKYLNKDTGVIMPDKAVLYLCAIEDENYRKQKIDFWEDVYGFDMTCIKDIAMQEPLVDVVESSAVISNAYPVLTINIMTCTKADLAFSSDFQLKANRNDYCHAFVGFFECGFTLIHKPIIMSTSPHAKYTHWKHTVFYLEAPLTVCEGETITGHITCAPNSRNPRDLDIGVNYTFQGRRIQVENVSQEFRLR